MSAEKIFNTVSYTIIAIYSLNLLIGNESVYLISTILSAIAFFAFSIHFNIIKNLKDQYFIFFILLIFGIGPAIDSNLRTLGTATIFLVSCHLAYVSLNYDNRLILLRAPFFLFMLFTGYLIAIGTDQYEFNEVLAGGSRNVYSAYLIATATGYLIACELGGKKPSLILMTMLFIFNINLYSRTGITFSLILLVIAIIKIYSISRNKLLIFYTFLLLLMPLAMQANEFIFYILENSNFKHGTESERYDIWEYYISTLDAKKLIFGNYLVNSNELIHVSGNLHNAYLRLHSYFGLGSIIFIAYILYRLKILIDKKFYYLSSLTIIIMARAIFEPVFLFSWIDYIIFSALMFPKTISKIMAEKIAK